MKLIKPKGFQSQGFGGNAEAYAPLKGHSGEDYVVGFKKPIPATVTGYVYSVLNQYNPNPQKYRCVYQIFDDEDFSYEIAYGHLSEIHVAEGAVVQSGSVIGLEGNYGFCMVGGKEVPAEEKASGKGSHLHFQVRKCKRVKKRSAGKTYLRNSEGLLRLDGMYYEVVNYDNGYNGCIDPSYFYVKVSPFVRRLRLGDEGEDVRELQRILYREKLFPFPWATTIFGTITEESVKKFQLKYKDEILKPHGLTVPTGIVGDFTIKKLNTLI